MHDLTVGLCFDLRTDSVYEGLSHEDLAEFDSPATIDALSATIAEHGCRVDRIGGIRALVDRLRRGDRWDLVFNIAEGRNGFGREAQVPALLDAYEIPYTFSDPLVAALTLHKGLTKRILRDAGMPTAPFAVVESIGGASTVDMPFPLLAKPVAEGTSKGIGADAVARDPGQLAALCERLFTMFRQPVLVEAFLPGRELTVGIVGTGDDAWSIGALEVEQLPGADMDVCSFRNKEECESLVRYTRVDDRDALHACEIALDAWRLIGARDGGRVDLRADASGAFQILEINPLPGMHPTHSDLPILWGQSGRPYVELVGAILDSALKRVPAASRA
ncbi:MAG: D-alanine--D-alanine ligase [Planctomycetes bacterium]|nr:D-alanine--D-alanine ligase [Planctomycetota bacterium]MCB9890996.1 D-alanine--D-alanine ligase [Planctomycetota bacterium]MCB9919151.1 D-alanine--D-alanine ligase [Planctomycetota bacterium]